MEAPSGVNLFGTGVEPERPRGNRVAWIGMWLVVGATILSPLSFLGCTFPPLLMLGLGGLVVCGVGLAWRPRWPAAVGLVVGVLCLAFWTGFFWWSFDKANSRAAMFGLTTAQHAQLMMNTMELYEDAEAQRGSDGKAASVFDWTVISAAVATDPWGHPIRYVLQPSTRGYAFFSDGADGVAGTPDDIDLSTLGEAGTFVLPPIRKPRPVQGP